MLRGLTFNLAPEYTAKDDSEILFTPHAPPGAVRGYADLTEVGFQ
jgi:hypothetical protein